MDGRWPVILTLVVLLAGCAPAVEPGRTESPGASPPTSARPSSAVTTASSAAPTASAPDPVVTPTPAAHTGLVYFVVDTTRGLRLAREPRSGATDAKGAIEAMIAGPTDPDYVSSWPKDTRVLAVDETAGVITVDLSGEARGANVGAAAEAALVQQLVWTVTEAADPTASVLATIEGEPASWGHLSWDEPIGRDEPLDVRLLVGINSPGEWETVTSPVRLSGEANVFEATLPWIVMTMDGATVQEGFVNTREGQTFAPWELTLTLPPGSYVLEVYESDPSGGLSGRPPDRDSRNFTVA